MPRFIISAIIFGLATLPLLVFAADQSGGTYEMEAGNPIPAAFEASSGAYQLEGSVEPVVGREDGATYYVLHGVQQYEPPAAPGGVGGGAIPLPPAEDVAVLVPSCGVFINPHRLIGLKDQNTSEVYVNGSQEGVEFVSSEEWTKEVALNLGENTIEIEGKNPVGWSGKTEVEILRRAMGDANLDLLIDDYDVSVVAAHWQQNFCQADFNEDMAVNDYDLSILAAYWRNNREI